MEADTRSEARTSLENPTRANKATNDAVARVITAIQTGSQRLGIGASGLLISVSQVPVADIAESQCRRCEQNASNCAPNKDSLNPLPRRRAAQLQAAVECRFEQGGGEFGAGA